MNLKTGIRMFDYFTRIFFIALCMLVIISGCDTAPKGEKQAAEKQSAEKKSTEKPASRMSFDQLFEVNDNKVTPKQVIRLGSSTMTPSVPFESNVIMFENAPFSQYIGREAEVKKSGDVYEIVRFY